MSGGPHDPTDQTAYKFWYDEKLRFSDTDMIGHINNVAFAALFESGRVNFTRAGVVDNMPPDLLIVMRHIEIDYRAEIHWPNTVQIGSRLLRIGRTSFAIGSAIFVDGRCAATSVTTLVCIHKRTRKPEAIPEIVRLGMAPFLEE